jgi:4-hydroxy-L-threonine phosphate dehydrogenase PdxA
VTAPGRPRIALAIGDPNGIGPEIAVKAAAALAGRQGAAAGPVLVGDPHVVRHYAARHAPGRALMEDPAAWDRDPEVLALAPVDALPAAAFRPGEVSGPAGAAAVAYVREALGLVRAGRAAAIVAAPHSETAIAAAGIPFSGYPGLLAELSGLPRDAVFLMLVGGGLRIAHATLHERLRDALDRLTPGLVVAAATAADAALRAMGAAARPRIGIFGINPHAGEGGLFGPDDARVTEPAVAALRRAGVLAEGPAGADVMLAARGCDAYVAMVHDQGHIPVKLLSPRRSSALSIGAGVLFSSVGHGSAHDIAGRGAADPAAVLDALELLAGAAAAPRAAA